MIGYNYRMSKDRTVIGRGQLKVLGERKHTRRGIFESCTKALGELSPISLIAEANFTHRIRCLRFIMVEPEAYGATMGDIRLALE
jgi:dTDP-4-amino-4,6-dideoxygalactose transaminase